LSPQQAEEKIEVNSFMRVCLKCKKKIKTLQLAVLNTAGCQLGLETLSLYGLIGWLVDLQWVQALMVLMHLGLIDGTFVPHNLMSTQESPVPLPKFQMAPRLKILNVLWVQ
jgi:hypothetical protein